MDAGGLSKYTTINIDHANQPIGSAINYNMVGDVDGGADMDIQRKRLKEDTNRQNKGKLGKLLGGTTGSGPTPKAKSDGIDRSNWTKESLEWEGKLGDVAKTMSRTDKATAEKIWDKFDRNKKGKLDCDKSLSRLIYSFFALHIKTRNREQKPPKYQLLAPLLTSICADIRRMINEVGGDPNNNYITKEDFVNNIAGYLAKIADQRK